MVAIYTDLKDKVVLVTGIGQAPQSHDPDMWGNGAATAKMFAQNGAKVFGCDVNLEAAEHTKTRILSEIKDATVDVISTDVTSSADVRKLFNAVIEKHGRIDILVCNVGKSAPGGPVEMSEEIWHNQLDVNLTSVYHCCHEALPIMEKQGSGVINLISSAAAIGYVGKVQIGYSTTKAALLNFAKVIGVSYARKGIRCNAIVPGLIHTPLVERLAKEFKGGNYEAHVAGRNNAVPQGHMGSAFDVANANVFLASDSASHITATHLTVDGGLCSVLTMNG
ncbi:short chain dehydrogenase [Xylogone sp. PMI_703]|nr:short chain dehydrogenase [Xylogone sp. PMI_703]